MIGRIDLRRGVSELKAVLSVTKLVRLGVRALYDWVAYTGLADLRRPEGPPETIPGTGRVRHAIVRRSNSHRLMIAPARKMVTYEHEAAARAWLLPPECTR